MRIILVITRGEIGGAQVAILNLAKALKNMGQVVIVGSNDERYLNDELMQYKIPAIQFKWLKRTYNPFAIIMFILELYKFIKEYNFDVVHLNSSNVLFGAVGINLFKKKTNIIFTFHGLSILDENYKVPNLLKKAYCYLFKFLLLFFNKPVFVSQRNMDDAIRLKIVKKGDVIYNGLEPRELSFISKEDARLFLQKFIGNDLGDKFLIGSIGRLAYPKNYEFLIKVFSEILRIKNNTLCIIIGDGPDKHKYLNLVKEKGLENHFYLIGEIKDAYKYIKAFDLFVLPSKYEGLSITLLEALFAQVPILTTRVGGNPEVLDYFDHQLYSLDNRDEFLRKFKLIIEDRSLREDIIRRAKINANRYLLENTVKEYLEIYKQY